ncbi:MAG TPA: hypothetical protein PKJ77_07910, partial [Thermodesulfobacteriota bacterium]|nr:hypothetical protein [Thermodesulfobacteriota bacterium]
MNRSVIKVLILCAVSFSVLLMSASSEAVAIKDVKPGEDVFAYVTRIKGAFDQTLYQQVIGASNAFKEGDQAIGV